MGNFYISESIHDRGDFILAAFAYSSLDLTQGLLKYCKTIDYYLNMRGRLYNDS